MNLHNLKKTQNKWSVKTYFCLLCGICDVHEELFVFKILCIFSQLSKHMGLYYTSNVDIVQQGNPICCRAWKWMFFG